jgi:L-fucose mutarotase
MLSSKLIHPEIIGALAGAGHGAKVLIADSNYPASTKIGPSAQLVYLNLQPGQPSATEVLDVLLSAIEVEGAMVMQPDDGSTPAIFGEFEKGLPKSVELQKVGRFEFYDAVQDADTCLVIQTGEQRLYANIMLVIGAIAPK